MHALRRRPRASQPQLDRSPASTAPRLAAVAAALALLGLAFAPATAAPSQAIGTNGTDSSAAAPGRAGLAADAIGVLIDEALQRNPSLERARRQALAAEARAPQAAVRPDPEVSVTLFALPPETRVGPQRVAAGVRQELPLWGKLDLRERRALALAEAAWAELEALRLDVATAVRTTAYELAFLDRQEEIVRGERATLERYDAAAQARYSAGTGMLQEAVRIQAQITRIEARLLDIAERRAVLLAQLNGLRDRPSAEPAPPLALPALEAVPAEGAELIARALDRRPELAALDARIAAHRIGEELALRRRKPDLMLGLQYTAVEAREDLAGRTNPPQGNGDDVLTLTGSIRLPIWSRALEAGIEEARHETSGLEEQRRVLERSIENQIGELTTRLPLLREHHDLLEGVLLTQARESLRSAETAYRTGGIGAVDLLDAEVVLFEVRIAAARTRTDHAVALARLERAVGAALDSSRGAQGADTHPEAEGSAAEEASR
ncbi:MAG: TolC family protein [Acidobacteria bacterium]|nr:MAG: TolC family protein [Acidobacteriota bacterium]REK03280.1 MAG: TolC family protein [Acidobacteriota bacterium]